MKKTSMWVALAGVLGCAAAGAPSPETVTRVEITSGMGTLSATELHNEPGRAVHTLPLPADSVWPIVPGVYERLGIPGAGAVPGELTFGARNVRPRRIEGKRLSAYIDCGMGPTATPRADEYRVTLTLITQLQPEGASGTRVETVSQATARPRDTSGNAISCQSNGTLEARVAELVLQEIASGG